MMLHFPNSYTTVFGIQRTTEIIGDDVGFLNYKNKSTETKMKLFNYTDLIL